MGLYYAEDVQATVEFVYSRMMSSPVFQKWFSLYAAGEAAAAEARPCRRHRTAQNQLVADWGGRLRSHCRRAGGCVGRSLRCDGRALR